MAAWATSNLFAAQEDVKIAEQDVEKVEGGICTGGTRS